MKRITLITLIIVSLLLVGVIASCGGGGGGTSDNGSSMQALPDTGQTGDFTATFGEDSDYTINPPSYTANGDSTVTDNVTGLMWQQEDDNTPRTWDEALLYCDGLALASYSDWRLPAKKELISIVDYGTNTPAIDDAIYFPGTDAARYWSSTTYAADASYVWSVYFDRGVIGIVLKTYDGYYVRCVR